MEADIVWDNEEKYFESALPDDRKVLYYLI